MRKTLLSLTAAAALASAAALVSTPGSAMGASGVFAIQQAAGAVDLTSDVRMICRHRWSSRERCRWVPGRRWRRW